MPPSREQRRVIEHDSREHGRVLAGPGTGKSRTSVALLRRLTAEEPDLAVRMTTFTRTAAQELARKFERQNLDLPRPTTIHSLALSILMRNPDTTNLPLPLRIPDGYEAQLIRKDIARRLREAGYEGVTSRTVNRLEQEMAARWESLDDDLVLLGDLNPQLRNGYLGHWDEHRRVYGYTLLGEVPFRAGHALIDHEPNLGPLDFLIVDEYQDLNRADIRLLEGLARRDAKILAIGDDDQSVYSFRMAAPQGIIEFAEQFGTEHDFSLTTCYRCGRRIIEAATQLIETAPNRAAKPRLQVHREEEGRFFYARFRTHQQEAAGVADMVAARRDAGVEPSEIVVLVRSSVRTWAGLLEPELQERGVELVNTDWIKEILERPSFRAKLSLLRIAASEADSLAWWVLLEQARGVSQRFRDYIYDRAAVGDATFGQMLVGLYPSYPDAPTARSKNAAVETVESVLERARELREDAATVELLDTGWGGWILDRFGPEEFEEDEAQLLEEVGSFLDADSDLAGFLGQLEPIGDDLATQADGVRIMTMTKSKGLTVNTAFVMGVERGLIPRQDARDPSEERRLLYVAMTRAADLCVLTYALRRTGQTARQGSPNVAGTRSRCPLLDGLPVGEWQDGDDVVAALQAEPVRMIGTRDARSTA